MKWKQFKPLTSGLVHHCPTTQALVTAFPCALAMAAAWDVDVAAAWGAVMGDEQRRKGMHIMLGPGLNLARVPLNGRNMEYFGEDPVLAGAWVPVGRGCLSQAACVVCGRCCTIWYVRLYT